MMRVRDNPNRRFSGLIPAMILFAALASLSACTSTSYAGIPLSTGAADPELQALARRAQAGDKYAQLELGIRYEEGRGVPRDVAIAERLYEASARTGQSAIYVYSPAVGPEGRARVVPLRSEPRQPGLVEAECRLRRLREDKTQDDSVSSGSCPPAPVGEDRSAAPGGRGDIQGSAAATGNATVAPATRSFYVIPFSPLQVLREVLRRASEGATVDPPSVEGSLSGASVPGASSVRVSIRANSVRYRCASNFDSLPSDVLAQICEGQQEIESYRFSGEPLFRSIIDGAVAYPPYTVFVSNSYYLDQLRADLGPRESRLVDVSRSYREAATAHFPFLEFVFLYRVDGRTSLLITTTGPGPSGTDRMQVISIRALTKR